MSDAWAILIAGSTITDGDAWEHLEAQGGGEGIITVVVEAMREAAITLSAAATVNTTTITAEILGISSATSEIQTATAEIATIYEAEI